jgi:hypothetical protein
MNLDSLSGNVNWEVLGMFPPFNSQAFQPSLSKCFIISMPQAYVPPTCFLVIALVLVVMY